MRHSFGFLPVFFFLLPVCISCQKEDLTFDESFARITKVYASGVGRNNNDDAATWPYDIFYTVSAVLSDVSQVEEWGLYYGDESGKKFSFEKVSNQASKDMMLSVTSQYLFKGENNSYYLECSTKFGLYMKKKNRKGDISIVYGDLKEYFLHFEFPSAPSVEFSNPKIISLEEVEEDGVAKYKTTFTYDFTVKGSFWIDHLEDVLSSGWQLNDESNYFYRDGTYSRSTTATYTPRNVAYSRWTVIHLCDSDQTMESKNWLNISGDPSISKVEVSDTERNI